MKCPRCGLPASEAVPRCRGCSFCIDDLDRALGAPPARAGLVLDEAGLLDGDAVSRLTERLRSLGAALGGELVVVTRQSTRPVTPEQYAFWLCNRWQVGGEARCGLLILVASEARRVECEVGYGWESVLGEDETGQILDDHVVPALKERRVAEGLLAAAEAVAAPFEAARAEGTTVVEEVEP